MPRRVLSLVALAGLVATISGCATSVRSAVFMSAPPVSPDHDVRIYQTQMPSCAYDEIGIVTWPGSSRKLQEGVEKLRARAREMGGHAIIGFSIGERTTGTTTTVSGDSTSVVATSSLNIQNSVSGTVIRFRNADCIR